MWYTAKEHFFYQTQPWSFYSQNAYFKSVTQLFSKYRVNRNVLSCTTVWIIQYSLSPTEAEFEDDCCWVLFWKCITQPKFVMYKCEEKEWSYEPPRQQPQHVCLWLWKTCHLKIQNLSVPLGKTEAIYQLGFKCVFFFFCTTKLLFVNGVYSPPLLWKPASCGCFLNCSFKHFLICLIPHVPEMFIWSDTLLFLQELSNCILYLKARGCHLSDTKNDMQENVSSYIYPSKNQSLGWYVFEPNLVKLEKKTIIPKYIR